jgi:hypothetical protein
MEHDCLLVVIVVGVLCQSWITTVDLRTDPSWWLDSGRNFPSVHPIACPGTLEAQTLPTINYYSNAEYS